MKLRFWNMFRRAIGWPRLTIPYAHYGWITVAENEFVQMDVLATGYYEKEVWNALAGVAERNEVVWDVGAHIGTMSIRALHDPRVSQVHAFEPDPRNAKILAYNLALNKGACTLYQLALGDEIGKSRLYCGPITNTAIGSLISNPSDSNESYLVQTVTADEMVARGVTAPSLMKVDVERWEAHVFRGARNLLETRPPKAIVFETDSNELGEMLDLSLKQFLNDLGYEITHIKRPSGSIISVENYIALHRRPRAWVPRD